MKKTLLALALITALTGCALLPTSVDEAEERIADAVVKSAERTICRNIPIGAWMRHYGNSAESREAWEGMCTKPAKTPKKS